MENPWNDVSQAKRSLWSINKEKVKKETRFLKEECMKRDYNEPLRKGASAWVTLVGLRK